MKRKLVHERPGLIEYLDKRLGSHTGRPPELQYYCAFCLDRVGDESSKRKLRINVDKVQAICFRCNWRGHISSIFKTLNGGHLRLVERMILKGEIHADVSQGVKAAVLKVLYPVGEIGKKLKAVPLPVEAVPLMKYQAGVYAQGYKYLVQERGVSLRMAELFNVHYCPTGPYARRLVFPVYLGGEQVYFTTRYCGEHATKAKNPVNEEGHYAKSDVVLNFDACVGARTVVLVEGAFDCMAFSNNNAVALIGKTPSTAQIRLLELLVEYGTKEFVIVLDSDADPAETYQLLFDRVPSVSVLLLAHGDPHDRRAEATHLLAQRRPLTLADQVRRCVGRPVGV